MKTAKRTRSVTTELFFIYFLGYILITVIVIVSIFFSLIMYEVLCGQRMYNSYFVQLESKLIEDYRSITEEDLKHINGFLVKITNQNQISYSVGNVIDEFKQVDITTYMKIFGVEEDNSVLLNSDLRSSTAFLDLNNSIIKTRKDINYSIYSMYLKEETAVVIIGCPYSEVTKPNAITRIIPHNLIIKMLSFFNVVIILLMVYLLAGLTSKVFVNPVKTLLKGVIAISNGEYDVRIESERKNEFAELSNGFNKMAETIQYETNKREELEKMREELILDVSHDLKTPLTSIINYIDLLKREQVEPESARDYIAVLDSKSQRLKALIEDLFEASKAASGEMELHLAKIDIVQLLRQTLGEFDEKLAESLLEIRTSFPDEKVYVNGDGRRLFRVFENLISNITKYSLRGTRVYIDIIKDEKNAIIIMKNISSYELNFDAGEITNRFKRGDEARTTEGSGLGLAIAKSIVELHGGELNIEIDGDLFKSIIKMDLYQENN